MFRTSVGDALSMYHKSIHYAGTLLPIVPWPALAGAVVVGCRERRHQGQGPAGASGSRVDRGARLGVASGAGSWLGTRVGRWGAAVLGGNVGGAVGPDVGMVAVGCARKPSFVRCRGRKKESVTENEKINRPEVVKFNVSSSAG
jgi:hypothetical protein